VAFRYLTDDGHYDPGFGFTRQFEWDGERWLFRRGGRDAPVEVTRDEMIRSETLVENGTLALVAVLLAAALFGILGVGTSYNPSDPTGDELAIPLTIVGAILVGVLGHVLLNRIATREFRERAPLGPPRTRLEVRRKYAQQKSWFDFAVMFVLAFWLTWTHWPPVQSDWFPIAVAAILAGSNLFDLVLKRQARRL
jgi:hypothetical protein